jgi:hypothetical protein
MSESGEVWTGAIANTLHGKRKKTAAKIAKKIWLLYWAIRDVVEGSSARPA